MICSVVMLFPRWSCNSLELYDLLGGNVKSSVVLYFSRDFLGGYMIFRWVYWVHRWLYDFLGCYTGFLLGYMIFFVVIQVPAA